MRTAIRPVAAGAGGDYVLLAMSGSSHHQTSPRNGVFTSSLPLRGMRQGRPTRLPRPVVDHHHGVSGIELLGAVPAMFFFASFVVLYYLSAPSDIPTSLPPGLPFSLVFRCEPGKEESSSRLLLPVIAL